VALRHACAHFDQRHPADHVLCGARRRNRDEHILAGFGDEIEVTAARIVERPGLRARAERRGDPLDAR